MAAGLNGDERLSLNTASTDPGKDKVLVRVAVSAIRSRANCSNTLPKEKSKSAPRRRDLLINPSQYQVRRAIAVIPGECVGS